MTSQKLAAPKKLGKLERQADAVIAMLLDGTSQREVAVAFDVSRRAIELFIHRHELDLKAIRTELVEKAADVWIADAEKRIRGLDEDWRALGEVQDARAKDETYAHIPGYSTGRMTHTIKSVGSGPFAQIVDEFAVDVGVIAERRALVESAARLLGQVMAPNKGGMVREVIIREYEGVPQDWIG